MHAAVRHERESLRGNVDRQPLHCEALVHDRKVGDEEVAEVGVGGAHAEGREERADGSTGAWILQPQMHTLKLQLEIVERLRGKPPKKGGPLLWLWLWFGFSC